MLEVCVGSLVLALPMIKCSASHGPRLDRNIIAGLHGCASAWSWMRSWWFWCMQGMNRPGPDEGSVELHLDLLIEPGTPILLQLV